MTWRLSLSTGVVHDRPLLDMLPVLHDAGFSRLQVAAIPGHLDFTDPGNVNTLRQQMERIGLVVSSMHAPFGGPFDLTQSQESARTAAVSLVEKAADALDMLGGETLVLHGGSDDEAAQEDRGFRLSQGTASLNRIYAHCRKIRVALAVEDMLGHLVGGRTEEVLSFAAALPQEGSGICLDTGHSFLTGDLTGRVLSFGRRIIMVHAHDNMGEFDDHLPPGEGGIPWHSLLKTLSDTGFDGEFVIEVNAKTGQADLLERARTSVLYLQSCLRDLGLPPLQ